MSNTLLALAALAAVPCLTAQTKLAGGPFVVNAGQRSATVVWIVETGRGSLGTAPDKLDTIGVALHAQKLLFTGLTPGTTQYYSVTGTEEGKGSFKTAPRDETPFQFVVYGDTRTRHDVHRQVIAAILKQSSPDFVVQTGDMVANGADTSLWPIFFDIERELLSKAAFFPVLGNHERNDRNFYEFFDVAATPYYSFNWGSCHFSMLDSDINNVGKTESARQAFWNEQVRWLEEDLQKSQSARFRFVVAHHPPMTAVAHRQGDNPHMTALMPLLEKYKVTAGLFGHDHNYQHYLRNGVHYFITGGGGAPLYDVDKPPQEITRKVASTENFLVVDVNGKSLRVRALTPTGETLETTGLGTQRSSARSVYPIPRTVCRSCRSSPTAIRARNARMKTYSVASLTPPSPPQPASASTFLGTMEPARRISVSSSAYSVRVSATARGPRCSSCVRAFSRRSSNSRSGG